MQRSSIFLACYIISYVRASFVLRDSWSSTFNQQVVSLSSANTNEASMKDVMTPLLNLISTHIITLPDYKTPFVVNCSVFFDTTIEKITCDVDFDKAEKAELVNTATCRQNQQFPIEYTPTLHKYNILQTSIAVGFDPIRHPQATYWLYFKLPPTQTKSVTSTISLSHIDTNSDTESISKSASLSLSSTSSITSNNTNTVSDVLSTSNSESISMTESISPSRTKTISLASSNSLSKSHTRSLNQDFTCPALAYADTTNQTSRYVIAGIYPNATVLDAFTGLIWEQTISPSMYFWNSSAPPGSAQAYCASLTKGNYTDWRLPNVLELQSLVDYMVNSNPVLNTAVFPGTPTTYPGAYFWTSVPYFSNTSWIWDIHFSGVNHNGDPVGDGGTASCFDGVIETSFYSVRCVRRERERV